MIRYSRVSNAAYKVLTIYLLIRNTKNAIGGDLLSIMVRMGTSDDISSLVEVECSDVEEWYHYSSEGRGEQASYDELSSLERYMHGGPWMDSTALKKYWKTIERLGIIPLVAEIEGKVVGHLDVIFSDELPLGDFLYLDVLMVHNSYRRRGVARTLIREAERLARNKNVGFMLVQPEEYEGPSGLTYKSCGFEKAFDTYLLETPIVHREIPSGVQLISTPQFQESPIKTHAMICGWSNISMKTWYYGVNPDLDFLNFLSCSQLALSALTSRSTYFIHLQQDLFDKSKGTLVLWESTPSKQRELQDIFTAAKASASWLGIETLITKTIQRYVPILERVGFEVKSKGEPYLIKNTSH